MQRKIITLREIFRKLKQNSQIAFDNFFQLIKIKLENFCQARHYLIEINRGGKMYERKHGESRRVDTIENTGF